MFGMESMLAAMLGVTPEQMQETIGNAVNLLSSLDARLNNIERMVEDLHRLDYPMLKPEDVIIDQIPERLPVSSTEYM